MLLIAGGNTDPNIDRLIERARHRACSSLPLLVGSGSDPSVHWDLLSDRLEIDGNVVRPSSVFLRHDVFTSLEEGRPETSFRALAWFTTVLGWAQAHDAAMLNRESSDTVVGKPYQLALAGRVGLPVPETRITNSTVSVRKEVTGEAIAKPVNGGGYATPLEEVLAGVPQRDGRTAAPAIVQERLVPPEVRIFAVGRELFAFEVTSDALDYRTSRRTKVTPVALKMVNEGLRLGLLRLLSELRMTFGAADFKTCPKTGELRFLEINSSPMFAAFDRVADGALCDAMIEFLTA